MLWFSLVTFSLYSVTISIEEENIVSTCIPPENGAGPFWCYGAPLIVRVGDKVFISAMETGIGVPPLCNTRWRIFGKLDNDEWQLLHVSDKFNEREPCPIVCFQDGKLFISVNPSTKPPGTKYGSCKPKLIEFDIQSPNKEGIISLPKWTKGVNFTDHSYRGIASDTARREILLLNIDAKTGHQHWSFRDSTGKWVKNGVIRFPIRSCYPQVALKDRSAYVLAIGDIVEPNQEWREYKYEKTKSSWDYVFRRLFFTYTPNILRQDFVEPIEIDNVDDTAGHITNLDLWIDEDRSAHLLYLRQNIQSTLMRDKFFPNLPIERSLVYVVIKDGQIIDRKILLKEDSHIIPGYARFHMMSDGTLLAVCYLSGEANRNALMQVRPYNGGNLIDIPLKHVFTMFFTATERGGSPPSDIVDLYGPGEGHSLRYARITIKR